MNKVLDRVSREGPLMVAGLSPINQSRALNRSTSLRVGAEGCAPILVTDNAAAAQAKPTASIINFLSASATASEPQKTSPAAVVSTAVTTGAATQSNAP
jgi:hypothetical protein